MASDRSLHHSHRSAYLRALALAAALTAALLALMNSGFQPGTGPMERSSFRGGAGYWLLAKDGGVFAFGDAKFFGPNRNQGNDIAGMAATATGNGYWTVDDDGDVFNYGDAVDYGSRPGPEIDDITGFAARSQGDGYWMVAKDGSVYAFGAAGFYGAANTYKLTRPIVGMAATPSGNGYWLIAGDGGVFAYGDAGFFGSTGSIKLAKPIVDFGPMPDGKGYRFIGNDGGVFAYGSAGFYGSTGALTLNSPVVGFASTASGNGYWLVGQDGGVFAYGDAGYYGSTGGMKLNASIVAIVATPRIKVAPIARADSATVAEDSSATIDVESNDTHVLPAAVSVDTKPAHGTATVSGTKIVYTPNANYNGSDSFTYKLTDTVGHSATATVTITVTSVEDVPVASDGSKSTAEDTAASGAVSATDGDGDALTYSKVADPAHGTLTFNTNGTYSYTPAANYNGSDSFTFRATDGKANSNTATVTLTVTAVNDPPTIGDIANQPSSNEDTSIGPVSFTIGDVDSSDVLTLAGTSSNTTLVPDANITFGGSGTSPTVTVAPAADQSGTSTITVTVSDGNGGTASDTFSVTVTAVNDAPTISDIADQLTNKNTAAGPVSFTIGDVDTAVGSLTVTTGSSDQTLLPDANIVLGGSGTSRTVTLTPATNQTGTATVTVTVSDGSLSSNDTFVLTVNAPPTITDIADLATNEDTPTGALPFTIGDAETLAGSLTVSGSSNNTTLVPNGNIVFGGSDANRTVTVTPASNQFGTATITVTVGDGNTGTASDSFVLTVNSVNDLPTISDISDQTINQDEDTGALSFTVADVETAAASLTMTGSSDNTTLVPNGNIAFGGSGTNRTVTVTPAAGQFGTATITVTVHDANSGTASDSFVLTVNALPTISAISDLAVSEDTATGAIAFTVGDAETAAGSLTLTGSSSDQTVVADGDIVFGGAGAARTVTVTPVLDSSGTAVITITVDDGDGGTASETFTLTVAVNDQPVAADLSVNILDIVGGDIDVLTDSSGLSDTPVQVTIVAGTLDPITEGTATVGLDGTIHFTPAVGGLLNFSFDYVITDADGDSDTGTVTVTII